MGWMKMSAMVAGAVAALTLGGAARGAENGLSGLWAITPGQLGANKSRPELTPEAKALPVADPRGGAPMAKQRCLPVGEPHMLMNQLPFEIIESPERIAIIGEQTQLARTIYMNTDKHAADVQPAWNGNSWGKWVNGTLVVDVAGFNDAVSHIPGVPKGSVTTHIVETFKVTDAGKGLVISMTFDDPKVLAKPYSVSYHYDRLPPGSQRWEYICDVDDPMWNSALGFDPAAKTDAPKPAAKP